MSRVLQAGFTGLAAVILLGSTVSLQPAAARIQCQGEFQVTQYGLIATPYCGDEAIARVARSYGWREADTVGTNPLSKVYICPGILVPRPFFFTASKLPSASMLAMMFVARDA